MATTKVVTVLRNDVTLTAGAADTQGSTWTLDNGYGGTVYVRITNGATGPTVAAQVQLEGSPDNSNWYDFGGPLVGTTVNADVTEWAIDIPIGVEFLRDTSGSNTAQDVTLRIEGSEVTEVIG